MRFVALLICLSSCTIDAPEVRAENEYRQAMHTADPAWSLQLIDMAIDHNPRPEYYQYRAQLMVSLKQLDAAINDLGRAIQLQRSDPALYFNRGVLLFRAGRTREADDDFSESLRLVGSQPEALLYRSRLRTGDAARSDLEEARKIGTGLADPLYNEGVRAVQRGDAAEAERMFRFALDLDPSHSRAHIAMARIYMERHQFAEAAVEFDQAIPAHPRDAELYYHRGNARFAAGLGEDAFADFAKAVELAPTEPVYFAARGMAHHRVRHDEQKALADFEEAIRLDPKCHAAWYHRGLLRHERKELDAAELDLRRATSIRASPEGCLALGRVLHDRGEYDKALSLYRQAMDVYREPDVRKSIAAEADRTQKAKESKK